MKNTFKKSKTAFENENAALQEAMKTLEVTAEQLEAKHTAKFFVFNVKEAQENEAASDKFTVEKTEETTLHSAKQEAMAYFKTFEGNIKIVEQDETHFVFAKVRQ